MLWINGNGTLNVIGVKLDSGEEHAAGSLSHRIGENTIAHAVPNEAESGGNLIHT